MQPDNTSLEQSPATSAYDSSLESSAPQPTLVTNLPGVSQVARRRHKRRIIWGELLAVAVIAIIGVAALILTSPHSGKQPPVSKASVGNYAVKGLPLQAVNGSEQLQIGQADRLAVNGQLSVNNTLVLSPTATPTSPVTGQIYYDKSTNQPYYYNGAQFVSLSPTAVPRSVTSLGGAAGAVSLGTGLTISGNQLSISSALLQSVANAGTGAGPRVTSLQGLTGDVTLTGGPGIGINGTTISNNGVISLASGSGNLIISNDGSGNYTITATSGAAGVDLGPSTAQTDASGNPSIFINNTGGSDLLDLQSSGVDKFVVNNAGDITVGTIGFSQVQGVPTIVNSIGGDSGAILLGTGLSESGNTLSNTGVTNFGGDTGAISVGTGLSESGNTITNSGVTQLAGTVNQISVSSGTGNVTLSLPQDIGTTSNVQFGQLTIGNPGVTGNLILNNSSNSNSTTLQGLAPSGLSQVITIPATNQVGGADTICLKLLGNCASGFSGSGTTNTLVKFTGPTSLGDSGLSDDGTTVSITGENLMVGGVVTTGTLQSTSTLDITPGGDLTVGATNQKFLLQGNSASSLAINANGHVGTINFTPPSVSADYTITFPGVSGTVCLQNSLACGFATSGSGVTTLNGLNGALTVANATTSGGNTITINNALADGATKGIATFNSSNFQITSGAINTIQNIGTASNLQFGSLGVGIAPTGTLGDLNLAPAGTLFTDTIKTTATGSGSLSISSDGPGSNINFYINGGTDSFTFPTGLGLNQKICTTLSGCAAGSGLAVILEPVSGNAQQATTNVSAIFINRVSGSGNLIQLQSSGSNEFVIDNTGNTTIDHGGVTNDFNIGGTLGVNTITPTGALTIGATGQNFTLQGSDGGSTFASGSSTALYAGSAVAYYDGSIKTQVGSARQTGYTAPTGPVGYYFENDSNVAPGNYFVCTTAGNCAGVGGSITGAGTTGHLSLFTGSGNIGDSVITQTGAGPYTVAVGGNLNVGVSGASQLSIGVGSSADGTLVFNNSTNNNAVTIQEAAAPGSPVTLSLPTTTGTFAVATTGPLSLDATTGVLSCATCATTGGGGSGAVLSITGSVAGSSAINGALSFTNALTTGTTISIQNASTSQFGLVELANTGNLTASSGVIDTAQGITTTSSPTFSNLTLQGSSGLSVGTSAVSGNVGQIVFHDGTTDSGNNYINTLKVATLTANRNITLPDASGTVVVGVSGSNLSASGGLISLSNSPTFSGLVTSAGLNAGNGLIQGTGGLTITGAAVSLNASSNFDTNINTGSSTGKVTIGNGSAGNLTLKSGSSLVVTSSNFNLLATGALTVGVSGTQASLTLTTGTAGNSITLQGLAPTGGSVAIQVPSVSNTGGIAGGNTYTICLLEANNCVGTGGGVTASGGTTNYVSKFTGGTTLTSSQLFDDSNFVGINTTTNSGRLSVVTNTTGESGLYIQANVASATVPVAIIQGGATPGAGADLLDLNTSSGNVAKFDNAGNLTAVGGNFSALLSGTSANFSSTLSAAGVNSNAGLLQGTGGLTVTGTVNINNSGAGVTNIGNASAGAIGILSSAALTVTTSNLSLAANTLTVGAASNTGTLKLSNNSNAHFTSLVATAPASQDQTITIPATNTVGGTDTVCLHDLLNCVGTGGGVTTSGTPTINYLSKFTGASTISNSLLYDNGSAITISTVTNNSPAVGSLLNVGSTNQFQVSTTGAVTAVGVNSGAGLIQGTNGLTILGTTSINASGAGDTNINTGTGSGAINIGNAGAGAIGILSSGALTVTTTNLSVASGTLTVGAASSTGTVKLSNSSNAHFTSVVATAPAAQDQTITIPATNTVGGTDTVCLHDLLNCVGTGGGVTVSGTTTSNFVAKFNGTQTITNSQLFDDGNFVGINTSTNSGQLSVLSGATGRVGLFVQGAASSTVAVATLQGGTTPGANADLLDLNTSSGNVAKFDNAGNLTAVAGTFKGTVTLGNSATAASLVLNNGQGASNHTATLQVAVPLGQNTAFTLPDPGSSAATFCVLSSLGVGNCSGLGGAVATSATGTGNTGFIPQFTNTTGTQIGDSVIFQSGTSLIGIGNTSPVALLSVGLASAFQVDLSGDINTSGLITGTNGLTLSGGTTNINTSGSSNTNIGNNTGTVNIKTSSSGSVTIGNSSASNITLATGSKIIIGNGSGTDINIGSNSFSGNIAIGDNADATIGLLSGGTIGIGASTVTNTNGSTVQLAYSTTALSSTQIVNIGGISSASTTSIQGNTVGVNAVGTLNLGNGFNNATINIGATNANASSVFIATGGGVASQEIVQIGSTADTANTLSLEAGTGASALLIGNGATAHGIKIGTGAAVQTLVVGSTNTTSSTTVQGGANGTAGGIVLAPAGGTTNVGVLVKPTSTTTAAFQVQNATSGINLLNADTTNMTLTVTAGTDTASLGANLASAVLNTTNWNGSPDWTFAGGVASHTGTGTTFLSPKTALTTVSGKLYQVTYTITNPTTAGTSLLLKLGATTIAGYSFDANNSGSYSFTDTVIATAPSTNANLSFQQSSTFTGSISAVSVQLLTQNTAPALVVNNAAGTAASLEVRASNGQSNLFVGVAAGESNIGDNNNTAFGNFALQFNTTGTQNTALGNNALQFNTTGTQNTAFGEQALQNNGTGNANMGFGTQALESNTTGSNNVGVGVSALLANTTGINNVGIGTFALGSNTTGSNNIGIAGLAHNTTGNNNVTLGGLGNNNGSNNVGIGIFSLGASSATLSNDTAVGYQALTSDVTGSNNTALGYQANVTASNLQNTTVIGAGAQVSASNTVVLGNTSVTCVIIGASHCTGGEKLGVFGSIIASGTITQSGAPDVAEYIDTSSEVTAQDVVIADPNNTEAVTTSSVPYDPAIVGIIADGTSGFQIMNPHYGHAFNALTDTLDPSAKPMTVAGRVLVKVTGESGSVKPGDYLTTSSTAGYAMKADHAGPTIGKALGFFAGTSGSDQGSVLVLVTPGYYGGPDSVSYIQNGGNATLNSLVVGGSTDLANLNVSGNATINTLAVTGSATIASLTVSGNAQFNGSITIAGHIITAGGQPLPQIQSAAGAQATVSVSGTDSTGTITITTGSNPTAGALSQILFSKIYGAAPHVVLSPSNDNAAGLRYYKGTATATDFMLNALDAPAPNTTYSFDYFVAQ